MCNHPPSHQPAAFQNPCMFRRLRVFWEARSIHRCELTSCHRSNVGCHKTIFRKRRSLSVWGSGWSALQWPPYMPWTTWSQSGDAVMSCCACGHSHHTQVVFVSTSPVLYIYIVEFNFRTWIKIALKSNHPCFDNSQWRMANGLPLFDEWYY